MKRFLRLALPVIVLLVVGGTALCLWLAPKKPALISGAACPPVRTSLAAIALAENPTARTYAAFGSGAGAFTNVFRHAGLVPVTNAHGAVRADIVFVSGEPAARAVCCWKEWCATNGILAIHFDVRKTTFAAFRRELEALPAAMSWRLWFPGRSDAVVTCRDSGGGRLADMLELFAREGLFADFERAGIDSLPNLLASFVGAKADVMPAFESAKGEVVPECFVTKEIPPLDWIDDSGVDADIREPLRTEIRSMQVIRRLVLQGDIHARGGKKDAAMDAWTRSIRRNPNDSLILERICLLDVNAETFLKVGNFPMAVQCLETMVCLRPKDVATARRLARALQQAGKKDLAAAVSKRADEKAKEEFATRLPSRASYPVPVSRLPSHDLKLSTRLESAK